MTGIIKDILEEYMDGLIKILKRNLIQVVLYGSYARGEQNQAGKYSDVDIMILVDLDKERIIEAEKEAFDYTFNLGLMYNIIFSPIIENIETYLSGAMFIPFYKNVKREGIILNG